MMRPLSLVVLLIILVSGGLSAANAQSADADTTAILHIVQAVKAGWEQADGGPFRENFLDFDGARYFESGGENTGLEDLIGHHVEPEGTALDLNLEFNNPQIHVQGDFAWVLFDTVVKATIHESGREIHNKGHETMILQKIDGVWTVLHTHSSSRPVKDAAHH
jgi:hypothetical protein